MAHHVDHGEHVEALLTAIHDLQSFTLEDLLMCTRKERHLDRNWVVSYLEQLVAINVLREKRGRFFVQPRLVK